MKISGFTFMRNTSSLYYPFAESIRSILPIVDEFIIAMGDNDPGDNTEAMVRSIETDKIKIINSKWETSRFSNGTIYAEQTDLAKKACTGDWLIYLQSDEVIHEKYLDVIRKTCEQWNDQEQVEGLLFNYRHFWGDYNHYVKSHVWYPFEIRIIRNRDYIHSYGDAQSFKVIQDFDGIDYRTKTNTRKLRVKRVDAMIYHYGWVRPPRLMQSKNKQMESYYHDKEKIEREYKRRSPVFDYGNLSNYPVFKETHPTVMKEFINRFNWQDELHYEKDYKPEREALKHEKLKYKLFSWIEENLMNDKLLFGYNNWKIIR